MAPSRLRRLATDLGPLATAFAVVVGASFLPPDTSRAAVERTGVLAACVPDANPPLVTGDQEQPGFDLELLAGVAERSGWRLRVVTVPAMGRDLNPRAWRITRAQCDVLAGGVTATATTRSFLTVTDPYVTIGWTETRAEGAPQPAAGDTVGFFAGRSGLDRIALAQTLRAQGLRAEIVESGAELRAGLEEGRYAAAVTDALTAGVAFGEGTVTEWLDPATGVFPIGLGFWKGDETLARQVRRAMAAMRADGTLAEIAERYGLALD